MYGGVKQDDIIFVFLATWSHATVDEKGLHSYASMNMIYIILQIWTKIVATPLLEECEDDTHIPEMGTWESSGTLETLELDCRGQNTSPWGVLHIIGNLLKCRYRKWILHMPFRYLQHKLWQKERPWVKLAIWLPTTKSQKSTRPRCVQVECDTPLESSQGELQVCFRLHPNWRSEKRVMNSQNPRSPNRNNFGTPPW
jgi:hypothetical protein